MSSVIVSRTGPLAVGIDLGTTFSVIASLDDAGRPYSLPNGSGDLLTPSAILLEDGALVIGKEAVKSSALFPGAYAECFKRDMGSEQFHRSLCGRIVPPEVLSAFILAQLKRDAEERLGPLTQAVITVPAFFDESRRYATQQAGRLAGLEVLDIINEPTAAALSFGFAQGAFQADGHSSRPTQRLLVYDLGGGTFDVTILEIDGGHFRALATDGDVLLGGKDFDERLVQYFAEQHAEVHGVDPRISEETSAQLWLDAVEAKYALSQRPKASVVVFHEGTRTKVEVSREKFEQLTVDLLQRTKLTTNLVLKQANLDWSQIDHTLLVGGSTRMPMVSRMLEELTGKPPNRSQSPDEAVAHGAALYCGMLLSKNSTSRPHCSLQNINSHALGVIGKNRTTGRKTNVTLIPKNTPLPTRASKVFRTERDNQSDIIVPVVEGEAIRPEDCIPLGKCVIRDLPPDLPKGTPIEVTYAYETNGTLSVAARVPNVRRGAEVFIQRRTQRDLESLEIWRERLCSTEEAEGPEDMLSSDQLARLDVLYAELGKSLISYTVPPSLLTSQQQAQQILAECRSVDAELRTARETRAGTESAGETRKIEAELARLKARIKHGRAQLEFALVDLGREAAGIAFAPPGKQDLLKQIRTLRPL